MTERTNLLTELKVALNLFSDNKLTMRDLAKKHNIGLGTVYRIKKRYAHMSRNAIYDRMKEEMERLGLFEF